MDYTEVINSTPVVLVEFYAAWCPHCKRMAPVVDEIKELLEGSVNVCQYDVDKYQELVDEVNVKSMPTFIIYRDGREVWRESGEIDGQALLSRIQSYM